MRKYQNTAELFTGSCRRKSKSPDISRIFDDILEGSGAGSTSLIRNGYPVIINWRVSRIGAGRGF